MSSPALFEPLTLRGLTVRNRAWVSPMCQYAVDAQDGVPTDWHLVHLGSFAAGGFGLILTEATSVVPQGRISPFDTGLWNDDQARAWAGIVDFVHAQGGAIGVQLGHAGRKASTDRWWPGHPPRNVPADEGGWQPVGPTTANAGGRVEHPTPAHALDDDEIRAIIQAFADAARRAEEAGFDTVEVHGAHGYLLHQFCSPLANTRTDGWGGSFENRTRLAREVARAVRAVFPADKPVLYRISGIDWHPDGWTIEDSVALASGLANDGVDLVDVSSGGVQDRAIPQEPLYQTPFSERIRREAAVPTGTVGLITTAQQAEQILRAGRADAVLLGREALRDQSWPLRAAHELGLPTEDAPWHPTRWRAAPR